MDHAAIYMDYAMIFRMQEAPHPPKGGWGAFLSFMEFCSVRCCVKHSYGNANRVYFRSILVLPALNPLKG